MIIDLFIPCYIDQFYPHVAQHTVKILEKLGCGVNYNIDQTCCGRPAFEDGYWDACKEVGEKLIKEFQEDRYVVSPGPGCVNTVKNLYPSLFHNSALHNEYKQVQKHFYELTDFLFNVMHVSDIGARYTAKAVALNACTCSDANATTQLLMRVRGLQLMQLPAELPCCGMGGGVDRRNEALSVSMAEVVLIAAEKAGAELIISNDYICLMHLEGVIKKQKRNLQTIHIAEVLASGWE